MTEPRCDGCGAAGPLVYIAHPPGQGTRLCRACIIARDAVRRLV
jgi:hypothetical protein